MWQKMGKLSYRRQTRQIKADFNRLERCFGVKIRHKMSKNASETPYFPRSLYKKVGKVKFSVYILDHNTNNSVGVGVWQYM